MQPLWNLLGRYKSDHAISSILLLEFFNTLWLHDTHPQAWQKSLLQPIHKGKDAKGQEKDRLDPTSYRGIYLSSAVAKLYEGLLIARITQYTEEHNTLTDNQIGTRPRRQIHDAIYSFLSVIQYNWYCRDLPTYVAFIDYTTAYPSVHRESLYLLLHSNGVRGNMWHQLRARLSKISVRVLHPGIQKDEYAPILRGLPEGSRLSPTLFGIVAADLIHFLRSEFPDATISHGPVGPPPPTPPGTAPPTTIWIGGLFYVDDLCLMSVNLPPRAPTNDPCLSDMERKIPTPYQHQQVQSYGLPRDSCSPPCAAGTAGVVSLPAPHHPV